MGELLAVLLLTLKGGLLLRCRRNATPGINRADTAAFAADAGRLLAV